MLVGNMSGSLAVGTQSREFLIFWFLYFYSLYGNSLTGSIPEEYCALTNLVQLDLSSNLYVKKRRNRRGEEEKEES